MTGKPHGVGRWNQMMAAVVCETAYVNGELFYRDENNATPLDAEDLELLEHIRQTGDVAAGSLGWLAPVEAARQVRCGRAGWPGPDITKPTHYEPHWRIDERTRRKAARQARREHELEMARRAKAEQREKRRQEAKLRRAEWLRAEAERRRAAATVLSAAEQARIAEQERVAALLDKRNTERATEFSIAARQVAERVAKTKQAIMAMMRQTYPTVWTPERLAAAVGCPDPEFVQACCEELFREGAIRR